MRCDNSAIGMELHYKVMIAEEKTGMLKLSTDTVVVLGYKFIQYALNVDPSTIPDDQQTKALTIV